MRNRLSTILGFGILSVLLMAGTAQSLAGSNTVFSDDIVDGTIGHVDVRANSLGGSRIIDDAVTGKDVNETTLLPTCANIPAPHGPLTLTGDVCYGTERPAANLFNAMADCVGQELRLPSITEARMFAGAVPLWADALAYEGTDLGVTMATGGVWSFVNAGAVRNYRCVTTVGARP